MFLHNDAGMVFDVGRRYDAIGEFRDVVGASHHLQLTALLELVGDSQNVDGLRLAEQILDGGEDLLVLVKIEGIGRQDVDNLIDGFLLQHQGTEHDFLEVGGLGRDTSLTGKDLFWRH